MTKLDNKAIPSRWRSLGVQLTAIVCLTGLFALEPSFNTDADNLSSLQFSNHQGAVQSNQQVERKLSQADVIYLGETHNKTADHEAQLQIIQALHQQNPRLVIGMEMFQRPYQSVLNKYIRGQISEAEMLDRTQYKTRWGFDWNYYAPIVRFAKDNGIAIIALNTPTEVTRKVSRQGLNSLNLAERRFIPPLSAIKTEPPAYRAMLEQIFRSAHHGHGNSKGIDRFFQAQVLWDETMAERIAQTLSGNRFDNTTKKQMVVLVGQGHLVYNYGIPWRVKRRLGKNLKQQIIILSPSKSMAKTNQQGQPIADLLRITPSGE